MIRANNLYGNPMYRMNSGSKILTRLIVINIIFFILSNIFISSSILSGGSGSSVLEFLGISSDIGSIATKPWTIITHMFTHFGVFHILSNMLILYWFGKILKETYGGQAVLSNYILGGLFGALFFVIFVPLLSLSSNTIGIGASGAVLSIVATTGILFPDKRINMFLIGVVKLKWVVLALVIMSTLINFHENIGGKLAHLGGVVFGIMYAYNLKRGKNISKGFESLMTLFAEKLGIKTSSTTNKGKTNTFRGKQDRRPKEIREKIEQAVINKKSAKREMEGLLDKIKKKGYKNISKDEKNRLKELSKYY